MKLVLIGQNGQMATALKRAAASYPAVEVLPLGRPALDLLEPQTVAAQIEAAKPELVINAAAYTDVDGAETDAQAARQINAVSAGEIARGAAQAGAPIIHISTDYVFDGSADRPYVETDIVAPLNVYGQTKLEGEQAVARSNPAHIVVRTAWIYSPWGHNFLRSMLRLGTEHDKLRIVADQFGNPTSAIDLAEALMKIADQIVAPSKQIKWGIYHGAGRGTASWLDFARQIFSTASECGMTTPVVDPITTAEYPTPAKRPASSSLDCMKLKTEFGIALPAWQDSVVRTLDIHLASNRQN